MLYQPDTQPPSPSDPRERHEIEDHWEATKRRHRIFGAGWLILALAIAAGAWYAYPTLKRHDAVLTQVAGVQKLVDSLGDQMKQADDKLQSWANDQQELRDQIAKLGQRMEAASKQAKESSANLLQRVQAQIDSRMEPVQTRLAHLESASDNEQTRVAELQRELSQVRRDMTRQGEELAAVRRQVEENGTSHDRQLASLKSNLQESDDRNRSEVNALQRKLAVRRVDFEVTKNHSRELAEGVSLGVTGTDIRYRRASGWMWLMPDRRTIWLKNQGAQEPIVFYGVKDGKKRELVITNVTKNSVTGYLLLPGDAPPDVASLHQSE
jgi:vacuolar-type H+-ATPase subunit I/STV1